MPREQAIHEIETHAACLCFCKQGEAWRCLVAQRTPTRSLFPGKWDCGGGQVQAGESFPAAASRQIYEEFGLDVQNLTAFGTYLIRTDDKTIPGVVFIGVVEADADVTCDPAEFSQHRWIGPEDLDTLDFIPGVRDDLSDAFGFLCNNES